MVFHGIESRAPDAEEGTSSRWRLRALGADSIANPEDSDYLAKLASYAEHVDAGSCGGLTNLVGATAMQPPAVDPRSCVYQGPNIGFACGAEPLDHFTFRLRIYLFDARGQAIDQFRPDVAASARVELAVTGTYVSPYLEPTVTVARHTTATIEACRLRW